MSSHQTETIRTQSTNTQTSRSCSNFKCDHDEQESTSKTQFALKLISIMLDSIKTEKQPSAVEDFLLNAIINRDVNTSLSDLLNVLCATPVLGVGYRASPLMTAALLNRADSVKLLIQSGADPNFTDMFGRTALIRLVLAPVPVYFDNVCAKRKETACILVESMDNKSINLKDHTGRNALLYSIESGEFAIFQLLIEHGADVNSTDSCDYLVDHPEEKSNTKPTSSSNGKNNSIIGFSALTYSVALSKLSIDFARTLIDNSADVNVRDRHGRTPLMYAHSGEKAQLLIEKGGADVNHRDSSGQTCLMRSLQNDAVCQVLIRSGADVLACHGKTGKSVLEMASDHPESYCAKECARICLDKLVAYFSSSSPEAIRKDVNQFVVNFVVSDQPAAAFVIDSSHFVALDIFSRIFETRRKREATNDDGGSKNCLVEFESVLMYLTSEEFGEKLWADVIQRLNEDNVQLADGQMLRQIRAKAKNEADIDRFNAIFELIKTKRQLAVDFYELTCEKLKSAI